MTTILHTFTRDDSQVGNCGEPYCRGRCGSVYFRCNCGWSYTGKRDITAELAHVLEFQGLYRQ